MFGIDHVSLLFLLFLVVLSGFVAYAGDLIGRNFGKKRRTIFGLRPRHTAAVMTGLFGGLATLIAVGALIAVSEPVRTWIVEGTMARQRLQLAEKDLKSTQESLTEAQGTLKTEQEKLRMASQQVADAGKQIATLRATAAELRKTVGQIRANLAASRRELAAIQTRYKGLLAEAGDLSRNNQEVVRQNRQLSARNLELEVSVGANEKRIADQVKELEKLNSTITTLNGTISDLQQRLSDEGARAAQDLARLRADIGDLERERDAAEGERLAAQRRLAEAQELLQNVLRRLEGPTTASRLQPMTYQNGDELARIEVRASLSAGEAKNIVLALFTAADSQAKAQGAGTLPDGSHAGLVLRYGPRNEPITEEEQRAAAIEALAGKPAEQVVVARAFLNSFRGEPVALDIKVLPNPVVYRAGEVVAELRIDGRQSENEILREIERFASGGLSRAAVEKGMVPAVGKPQPLGELPSDQLIEIVQTARQASRPLRLLFVAGQDTRAAQRLKLELRLR
jgi:uncharacterized protein (DUF3084 family)